MKSVLLALGAATLLSGCEPLSLTALGIGGSTAVNHTLGGITYRTFTASRAKVRVASIGALNRMGIKPDAPKAMENGEVITARAGKREIEVQLETISANTTRMRVTARDGGLFYDGATASEIIAQTERSLGV